MTPRDVEAAVDRGAHRGHLGRVAEQDRADDPAVLDHELAVLAARLLERDDLVARLLLEAADRRQLDADDLEHRERDRAVVGLVAADRVVGRDLGLLDRDRPQPVHAARVLGDVAGGEDVRVARAHALVDEHAAVDRQAGGAREVDVRRDARRRAGRRRPGAPGRRPAAPG